MIKITLPDNSVREFSEPVTGLDLAQSISPRLAKEVLSISVNGEIRDLTLAIDEDASVRLNTWDDREGKEAFWHSSAHLMAEAIEHFYPGTKFGIGPTVETGFYYDVELPAGQQLSEKELQKIEQKMVELARQKNDIVRKEISKADAMALFTQKNDELKQELISELEDGTITLYEQGNFTDLCRGPHLPNTGYIKAVKLTSIAGAYWRGSEKNQMLTRVYGVTFPKQKMLEEYMVMLEEAKKRDHRKIGKEMELFAFSEAVGQGLPLWLPKGAQLRMQLEDFLKKVQKKYGYDQVITPHIGDVKLYKTSGHYENMAKILFNQFPHPSKERNTC
jgi:threonyl-tRNA synthetase